MERRLAHVERLAQAKPSRRCGSASSCPTAPTRNVVWPSWLGVRSMTARSGWAAPLTTKWLPGIGSGIHIWYAVMMSLSASLTENRLDSNCLAVGRFVDG